MLLSFNYKKSSVAKNNTKKVGVGTYVSTVKEISYHPDYVDDSAILINYNIIDENGKQYEYSETFFNDNGNDRSKEFFEYLEANGISRDQLQDFVGSQERITIKKMPRNGRVYNTIAEREFINS